ncbi:hypothetical protein C8Q72DRAFT_148237 [Fomitopsis betulina]|nr:hypothetical protein C8Q72DRAFT_148237 [Fomitopsis betulina]
MTIPAQPNSTRSKEDAIEILKGYAAESYVSDEFAELASVHSIPTNPRTQRGDLVRTSRATSSPERRQHRTLRDKCRSPSRRLLKVGQISDIVSTTAESTSSSGRGDERPVNGYR